jgi:hypothetical protein
MTKAIATIALLAALISPCLAQETKHVHAPTVRQCCAEQRLWLSKLMQYPISDGVTDVSYGELQYWRLDMFVCANLDPAHEDSYMSTDILANREQNRRLESLLYQRNLFSEFIKQDAQGKPQSRAWPRHDSRR